MYLERILENAESEWENCICCTRDSAEIEYKDMDEDANIEFLEQAIENCKAYFNVFKNQRDKFIFLFDVFLHINSVENIEVKLNGEIFSDGYKVFGFEELSKNDIDVNKLFFDWLNRELLLFDFSNSIQDAKPILEYHYFHQVLETAFRDLTEMNNFIYDTTKPKKKVFVYRLRKTFEVYEFQNHNEGEIDLFFRNKIEKYEEPTLKIAYMVSLIEYLSMYNQYTEDGKDRPLKRSSNHKALTKIYNYLTKTIEKIDLKQSAGRGRPKINRHENDYKLNWKGTQAQLVDLIYELDKKGWIEKIEETKNMAESILGLFKVKDSDNISSFQQNMKQSVYDDRDTNRDKKNKNYFSEIKLCKGLKNKLLKL